jgi:hypothetical protein
MRLQKIIIIIILLLLIYLYFNANLIRITNHLIAIIIIEVSLITMELNNYVNKRKPKFLWRYIELINNYHKRRQFDKVFEELENSRNIGSANISEALREEYIKSALRDLSSVEPRKKQMPLIQLSQYGKEQKNQIDIYRGLIKAFERESDERFRDSLIGAICYFRRCCDKDTSPRGK